MSEVIQLAKELSASFTEKERQGGTKFRITENSQAKQCVHAVHDAMPGQPLPDDWLYAATERALDAIADMDDDAEQYDCAAQFADDKTDVYYYDLRQWFANCSIAPDMVNEAQEELGQAEGDIFATITRGQYYALERVFNTVYEWLESAVTVEV